MVLDQGYWPESLLTPPSEEAIINDIEWTKEIGFNGSRKHHKLEETVFLYHAARLGLLVSDEMANAYDYAARFTREWLEVVEREKLYAKYKDLGKSGERIPDNARAILLPGAKYNGSPFLLSEFGGIAYVLPGSQVPSDTWGYAGVEKSPEAVLTRLRGLYEAMTGIPPFAGICYTQLTDVEQEVNGLLSYDRPSRGRSVTVNRPSMAIHLRTILLALPHEREVSDYLAGRTRLPDALGYALYEDTARPVHPRHDGGETEPP